MGKPKRVRKVEYVLHAGAASPYPPRRFTELAPALAAYVEEYKGPSPYNKNSRCRVQLEKVTTTCEMIMDTH